MPHLRANKHIKQNRGSGSIHHLRCLRNRSLSGIALFFLFFSFLSSSQTIAREVRVQEVTISLHNKAVTGFKVRLDRSVRVVSGRVIDHVSQHYKDSPFQYDNTIIYENILYRPLSVSRELSLYYMLRNVQDQLTELTVVVMYDYHRSVNSHDFPSLSLLVQADLARLVRRTTGDLMRSDRLLFDDPTLDDLAPLLEIKDEGPLVEHFKEEEVENQGVLMHGDPFAEGEKDPPRKGKVAVANLADAGGNPELDRLRARVKELEIRERQLLDETDRLRGDQAVLRMKQEQMMTKLKESKFLQDSIKILNLRIEDMLGQFYVSDDFSVSSETAAEMQDMEKRLQVSQDRIDFLTEETDSLQERNDELRALLATTGTGARKRAKEIRSLQSENKGLAKRNEDLREELLAVRARSGASSTSVDSLLDALGQQRSREQQLQSEIAALEKNEQRLQADFERSSKRSVQFENRIKDLEAENRNLSNEIATLRTEMNVPVPIPSELRDSLRLMTKRLAVLEAASANGEAQAEAYLKQSAELAQKKQEAEGLDKALRKSRQDLAAARKRSGNLETELGDLRSEKASIEKRLQKALDKQGMDGRERDRIEAERDQLTANLRQAELRESDLKDSLRTVSSARRQLRQNIAKRDRQLRLSNETVDSISTLLSSSRKNGQALRNDIQALELRIDSLESAMPPSDDQANFIREQWAKLQTWEKELNARSVKVGDREKLVDQRSRFLVERETELESREARIEDLEERETRVKALEERLKASETDNASGDVGRFTIREGRVVEFGVQVPVLISEIKLSPQQTQRRIAAYFLSRGEFADQQFPDLVFNTVQFTEFDDDPMDIQVRVDSRPNGSVIQISFKYADGRYIGPNSSKQTLDTARQLLGRMIRFNF